MLISYRIKIGEKMDIQTLDNNLKKISDETRENIMNFIKPLGEDSLTYHDETIKITSDLLDSMDRFREEIINYLKMNIK